MPRKRIEYLDREELSRIENLEIKVGRLEIVRDVFVFCCHTGLAYAEVSALRPEHIFIGMDNEQWLRIMRKKTKKEYAVPILPKAKQIIEKYKNHSLCQKKGMLLPVYSNVKMNAYLKEIADLAGIHQNLDCAPCQKDIWMHYAGIRGKHWSYIQTSRTCFHSGHFGQLRQCDG